MRKIKKFKIPIYLYEITRKAKKNKINLEELGLKEQNSFKEFVSSVLSGAQPATVFDFFAPDFPEGSQINAIPQSPLPKTRPACPPCEPLRSARGGNHTVVSPTQSPFSAGVLTFGSEVRDKINAVENTQLRELALISIKVFSDTGINLISELILQEAELEGFKLGPVHCVLPCPDTSEQHEKEQVSETAIQSVLKKLECSKIGVKYENNTLVPEHTVLFSVPWIKKNSK